jgi:hypothetical protein
MWRQTALVALALFLLFGTGCLISEQEGQGVEELAFHFDTDFNRIVLFARSAAIGIIALWVFAGSRKQTGTVLVGVAILVVALGLFFKDYPTLSRYSVQVLDEGLVLRIPPEEEKSFPWAAIEEMYVEGVGPASSPHGDAVTKLLELPDWHTMRITLAGGETHLVDLKLLSVEQRQTLWRSIARRAQLVEIDE